MDRTDFDTQRSFSTLCWILALVASFSGIAEAFAAPSWVGLSSFRSRRFHETGSLQGPAPFDRFGEAVATGDFDGDGVDDLAIGTPGNDCITTGPVDNCGRVFVRRGVAGVGVGPVTQPLDAQAPGSPRPPQSEDRYGAALASGDFNGDGKDDLAIGVPASQFAGDFGSGNVQIHFGESGGVQAAAEQILEGHVTPNMPTGNPGGFRVLYDFGDALAVGDFDGDGHDDLAIGAPESSCPPEDVTGQPLGFGVNCGAVMVAGGHIGGLIPFGGFLMRLGEEGLPDTMEGGELFGTALASGDFNGDSFDDLAIGVPQEDGVGAVLVVFGSPNSLIFANHYYLGQFDLGTTGQPNDRFGETLATGDFNGDGYDDLVMGAPGENNGNGTVEDIGMVGVLYGAPGSAFDGGGFNFSAMQWWWGDLIGAPTSRNMRLGSALATGDFDADGYDDLAIGAPGDDMQEIPDSGSLVVLSGSPTLLYSRARRFFPWEDGFPTQPVVQNSTHFGEALASGDFDGNKTADLAVGMPSLNTQGSDDGAVLVLYGALFADGFESEDTFQWVEEEPRDAAPTRDVTGKRGS